MINVEIAGSFESLVLSSVYDKYKNVSNIPPKVSATIAAGILFPLVIEDSYKSNKKSIAAKQPKNAPIN